MNIMKTGRTTKYLLINCLLFFFIAGCTEDIDTLKNNRIKGSSKITFSLKTGSMTTRSGNTIENDVKKLDILVFEENSSGEFIYQAKFSSEGTDNNLYEIELETTDSPIKLCLLVNAYNIAEEINENELWEEVIKKIVLPYDGTAPEYVPMFGEAMLEKLEEGDNISLEIDLLRALASVEVCLQTENPELTNKFELTSIQAYRANDKIQLIPDSYIKENGENGKRMKVTSPSVPSDAINNILTQSIKTTNENPAYSLAGLYIPEAEGYEQGEEQASEPTCIIIGGKYEGKLGYYRVDIKQQNTNKIGQVLRNYKYQIVVTNVTCPGYEYPEEAGDNPEISISTDIIEWEKGEDGIIYGPDGSYFGITADHITVNYFEGANTTVSVRTNNINYSIEWLDEQGNGTGNIIIPSNEPVSYGIFSLRISEDGINITATALEENTSTQERSQKAKLTLGSLQLTLLITQQTKEEHARDYITIFNFTGALGNLGDDLMNPAINNPTQDAATSLPFRNLLINKKNFGPDGVLAFGGFHIAGLAFETIISTNKNTVVLFDMFDVILVPNRILGTGTEKEREIAQQLVEWLDKKKNRVLITYNSNTQLIDALGRKNKMVDYFNVTSFLVPDNIPEVIRKGPFGSINKGLSAPISVPVDTYVLDMNDANNHSLIPILVNNGSPNELVFGIDPDRQVIYLGEHYIFDARSAIDNSEYFISQDGEIRKDSDKVIGNIFALVAETVLGEELAADKD